MAEGQRDVIIMEALLDIPRQPARDRHDFKNADDMRSFESKAAGHDHAYVARTEDDDLLARHAVVQVDVGLGNAGCEYARRPCAGDCQSAAGALAAAHRKYHRFGLHFNETVCVGCNHQFFRSHIDNGRIRNIGNISF